jgi:hypothetical protein
MRCGGVSWVTLTADNYRNRPTAPAVRRAVQLHQLNAECLSVNEGVSVDDDL